MAALILVAAGAVTSVISALVVFILKRRGNRRRLIVTFEGKTQTYLVSSEEAARLNQILEFGQGLQGVRNTG
ncbi:MAG TPA: hypothetical protein VKS22_02475 [Candidatus Binataceae bacterium]|nr:hypothetical protein [Candidatus Binataceae bacterium]